MKGRFIPKNLNGMYGHMELLCACSTAANINQNQVMDRVIRLVKKFDKVESAKVITLFCCDDMYCSSTIL